MNAIQAHRERVGSRIRAARKRAGLSHDRLASRVGTSRQHLIKLEKGLHLPGDALLSRIAEATDKPVSFFDGGDDDQEDDLLVRVLTDIHRALAEQELERAINRRLVGGRS